MTDGNHNTICTRFLLISPDRKILALGREGYNQKFYSFISLWNLLEGKYIKSTDYISSYITDLKISPNSQTLDLLQNSKCDTLKDWLYT